MSNEFENRLNYTRDEYEKLQADKKRQAENLEGEIERIAEQKNDLTLENIQLLAENKRLEKIEIEAQKLVDVFREIEQKQFELLGHSLEEACENWDEATSFGEMMDFSGLMQALE